ncbi:MAG: cardiolipin synthase [Spirochaetaceae bacterium]|nr:cardiolipin synthase [Spirochaetaceae bacterium]
MGKRWKWALYLQRGLVILLLLIQIFLIIYTLVGSKTVSTLVRGIQLFLSLGVCIHIIANNNKGEFRLTWVFLIMLFPLMGGTFYIIFNFQTATRKFSIKAINTENKSKKLLEPQIKINQNLQFPREEITKIKYLQDYAGFPVFKGCYTKYFDSGEAFLEQVIKELEKAENYIFLEYFIIQEGEMWNKILDILKRKVAQGVKVRVMYDDIGSFLILPKNYPAILSKMGIECQKFNPFKPFLTAKQNNRDHRKILSIDGKTAFTGGINLADEYINVVERFGHWKDSAVMVKGAAAWSFTLMFLQMWELAANTDENYQKFYPLESKEPKETEFLDTFSGFVQPYADSPMDLENLGEQVYLQIINSAKDYIYITTPYLIIDNNILTALCLAAKSGIDVRIITPFKWDKRIVHITSRSYYRELINAGVKVYEYAKGFIHSKNFVSDDCIATVGTTNLDFRSLYLHFECGLWMYKSPALMDVKKDFLETLESCTPITKENCQSNVIMGFIQDTLRIFAPIM